MVRVLPARASMVLHIVVVVIKYIFVIHIVRYSESFFLTETISCLYAKRGIHRSATLPTNYIKDGYVLYKFTGEQVTSDIGIFMLGSPI